MVVANLTGQDGRKILLLGLSEANVTALRAGRPIHLPADHPAMPAGWEVLICHGETEAAIRRQIEDQLGPIPPDRVVEPPAGPAGGG